MAKLKQFSEIISSLVSNLKIFFRQVSQNSVFCGHCSRCRHVFQLSRIDICPPRKRIFWQGFSKCCQFGQRFQQPLFCFSVTLCVVAVHFIACEIPPLLRRGGVCGESNVYQLCFQHFKASALNFAIMLNPRSNPVILVFLGKESATVFPDHSAFECPVELGF